MGNSDLSLDKYAGSWNNKCQQADVDDYNPQMQ